MCSVNQRLLLLLQSNETDEEHSCWELRKQKEISESLRHKYFVSNYPIQVSNAELEPSVFGKSIMSTATLPFWTWISQWISGTKGKQIPLIQNHIQSFREEK